MKRTREIANLDTRARAFANSMVSEVEVVP